jgi:hypothetical protein
MFHVETLINGRWVRISTRPYTRERAANIVANLISEVEIADASADYRTVPV